MTVIKVIKYFITVSATLLCLLAVRLLLDSMYNRLATAQPRDSACPSFALVNVVPSWLTKTLGNVTWCLTLVLTNLDSDS
jgi:hypothetical protein